jgi:hypothetical protein
VIQLPNDVWFIVAGWGVILGGLALYAVTLLRRLAAARSRAESPTAADHATGARE